MEHLSAVSAKKIRRAMAATARLRVPPNALNRRFHLSGGTGKPLKLDNLAKLVFQPAILRGT
jgi:hypothetical protein